MARRDVYQMAGEDRAYQAAMVEPGATPSGYITDISGVDILDSCFGKVNVDQGKQREGKPALTHNQQSRIFHIHLTYQRSVTKLSASDAPDRRPSVDLNTHR